MPNLSILSTQEYISFGRWSVRSSFIYAVVIGCWILYFFALMSAPVTSSSQFNVSSEVLIMLRLTVAIPYLIIWLAACYSYVQLKKYTQVIQTSPEAPAFQLIANGVFILLISLILSTFLSSLRSALTQTDWRPALTILTNYAYVLPYLAAFYCFYRGSTSLANREPKAQLSTRTYLIYAIPFIIFVFLWLESIFTNQNRSVSGSVQSGATYYLRDSLLILTIVIPSLITWVLGLATVMHLRLLYQHVTGVIYRKAIFSLVAGFILVILGSIMLQAVLSLGSQRIFYLGLAAVLGIVYLFLVIQTAGFLLVSRGAHNLAKIEAV